MTATMVRPTTVPYRWVGHNVDLRTYLEGDELMFAAIDVCTAIGIRIDSTYDAFMDSTTWHFPFPTSVVDGLTAVDGRPLELFTIDQVRELVDDRPMMFVVDDFGDFFESLVESLTGAKLETAIIASTPAEPGRVDLVEGRTYDIRRTAQILSRDPAIDRIGERYLFEALNTRFAWIHRVDHIWIPTSEQLRAGTLTRMQRRVPGRKALYPQIRVTPFGIETLHRLLGGVSELNLDPAPTLTLVDVDDNH